ncbi:MAG: response regulator [Elusimicrobiota bacterium]
MIFSKKKHILLVDDNEGFRETFTRVLSHFKYKITEVSSGREALEKINEELPDLVILDIGLPDISGIDILKTVKNMEKTEKVKVLMLSAIGKMGMVDKGFKYGADDYLIKPADINEVKEKIEKLLH